MGQIVHLLTLITKKFEYKDEQNILIPLGLYSKIKDKNGAIAHLHTAESIPLFKMGLSWLLEYVYNLCIFMCKKLGETTEEIDKFKYFLI